MSIKSNRSNKSEHDMKSSAVLIILISIIFVALVSLACGSTSSTDYSSGQSEKDSNEIDKLAESGPPIKFNGTGRTATEEMSLPSTFSKVTLTHNGSGNFIVTVYYGNEDELLVNEIGRYKGTTLIVSEDPVTFDIEADGSWTGKIEGVGKSYNASFSGTGDGVSGFFIPPKQEAWEISHNGDSNFAVWAHCVGGSDLIVNEIGSFSGSTIIRFEKGPCLWEVNADGSWSLEPR